MPTIADKLDGEYRSAIKASQVAVDALQEQKEELRDLLGDFSAQVAEYGSVATAFNNILRRLNTVNLSEAQFRTTLEAHTDEFKCLGCTLEANAQRLLVWPPRLPEKTILVVCYWFQTNCSGSRTPMAQR